jgi:hypothetical protein
LLPLGVTLKRSPSAGRPLITTCAPKSAAGALLSSGMACPAVNGSSSLTDLAGKAAAGGGGVETSNSW